MSISLWPVAGHPGDENSGAFKGIEFVCGRAKAEFFLESKSRFVNLVRLARWTLVWRDYRPRGKVYTDTPAARSAARSDR